jgi:hypothetical protein
MKHTISLDRYEHDIQKSRYKHFKYNKKISQVTLVNFLYSRGNFREIPSDIRLLKKRTEDRPSWREQVPYGDDLIDPIRASIKLYERTNNEKISNVRYLYENKISYKKLVASVCPNISKSPCPVPVDWYIWSVYTRVDLSRIYIKYRKDFINIFDYHPPPLFRSGLSGDVLSLYDKGDKSFFWDNVYGVPMIVNDYEMCIIESNCLPAYQKLMADKLNISVDDYILKCEFRNENEKIILDDYEEEEEDLILIQSILEKHNQETSIIGEKVALTSYKMITSIDDIDDDCSYSDSEEEQEEPDDELTQLLLEHGIEDVDLMNLGLIEDWKWG